MTLYELTDDYLQVMEMLEDPDVDLQTINDTLESIGGEIEEKADNYAKIITYLTTLRNGADAEKKRLTKRVDRFDNSIAWLKRNLEDTMKLTGKTKFKTPLFSYYIQKNAPSLVIAEGTQISEKYLIPQEPKVDNAAIKAALKDGEVIDGCTLVQGESLRIR